VSEQQALYDQKYQDERWEPIRLAPDATSTARVDDVARLLRGKRGKLLEIGCGSGRLLISLAEQFDQLDGFDLAARRVELGSRVIAERYPHLAGKVRLSAGDADQPFPYPDASFDVVIACAVIEHCVNVFTVMDELARVTRPGGHLVVTVPNICYIKHVVDLLRGRLPLTGSPTRDIAYWRKHGWDGQHFHYFSRQSLAALLRHCGFEPEEWTGDGKYARYRRWCTNLVGNLTVRARRVEACRRDG
jgi:ubiquinone/menaquinone biosynthesis C-methylase UbiE